MNVTFVHNHRRSKLNRIRENINLTQVNSLYGQRPTVYGNRHTKKLGQRNAIEMSIVQLSIGKLKCYKLLFVRLDVPWWWSNVGVCYSWVPFFDISKGRKIADFMERRLLTKIYWRNSPIKVFCCEPTCSCRIIKSKLPNQQWNILSTEPIIIELDLIYTVSFVYVLVVGLNLNTFHKLEIADLLTVCPAAPQHIKNTTSAPLDRCKILAKVADRLHKRWCKIATKKNKVNASELPSNIPCLSALNKQRRKGL